MVGRGDERGHAGDAEDVGDLVRIGGDRRRAQREHGAHEFVDPQLGRLEMHVGVDQAGRDGRTVEGDLLHGVPRAPARHDAIGDRQVGRHPLPARRREHPSAAQEQIGRCVAAGDGQDMRARTGRVPWSMVAPVQRGPSNREGVAAEVLPRAVRSVASSGRGSTRPWGGHRAVGRNRSHLRSTRALPTRSGRPSGPGDPP